MFYDAELQFLQNALKRKSIQTQIINPAVSLSAQIDPHDLGLAHLMHNGDFHEAEPCIMYKMTAAHICHYLFCLLPETPEPRILLIGPYLSAEPSQEEIFEYAEKSNVPPEHASRLEAYYHSLPVLQEGGYFFSLVDTFCELIWKDRNNYTMSEIVRDFTDIPYYLPLGDVSSESAHTQWNIEQMELRYQYENELIRAVSQGASNYVDRLLPSFSSMKLEQRLQDPVRNLKNYTIIMNTLLRKAAESGGVHPIYLDRVSSEFARKIELMTSVDAIQKLMTDMGYSYCKLVRKHSMSTYSAPVQKTIIRIDADLTADLSLHHLAEVQNLSSGYLSALFRRETGQTLTDFVNLRRVDFARHLLKTTGLQIQTIAQHCGITDVQYFSRLFKKYTGMTPKEYRNN